MKIIAIVGFSASGKDTVVNNLKGDLQKIVLSTTRPMRETEVDGREYLFYSSGDFLNKVFSENILYLYSYNTTYKNKKEKWYYGLEFDKLQNNKTNIIVCSIDLLTQLKEDYDVTTIYLDTSFDIRRQRCIDRKDYDKIEFDRRWEVDKENDKKLLEIADFVVNGNEDKETVQDKIDVIVRRVENV